MEFQIRCLIAPQTITELPASNRLCDGGVVAMATRSAQFHILNSSPATVSTDALDYPPGTPSSFRNGWQPNEAFTVTLHEDPHVDTESAYLYSAS